MTKEFRERRQRFSFRKLSVGLVSALLGTYFMAVSPLVEGVPVQANTTEQVGSVCGLVDYQYLLEGELTEAERAMVVEALPGIAQESDATYYLIYRPKQMTNLGKVLPKSGDNASMTALLAGLGVGLVLLAFKRRSDGKSYLSALIVVTALGASVLTYDALADKDSALSRFNQTLSVCVGDQLPKPATIDGYEYVGYLRQEKVEQSVLPKLEETNSTNEPSPTLENVDVKEEQLFATSSINPPVAESKPIAKIDKTTETDKQVVPFDVQYVEDSSLALGTEVVRQSGVAGSVTTTYEVTTVDGVEVSRQVVGSPETVAPVPQIVARGVFVSTVSSNPPVVEDQPVASISTTQESSSTEIPFDVQYVEDSSLALGTEVVRQSGVAGSVTTTYEVTTVDGVEVSRQVVGSPETVAPVPQIVARGVFVSTVSSNPPVVEDKPVASILTTQESSSTELPFDVQYVEDSSLALGTEVVRQSGVAGSVTTTYEVTTVDGVEVSRQAVGSPETVAPVPQIVARGVFVSTVSSNPPVVEDKPVAELAQTTTSETIVIDYDRTTLEDPALPVGQTRVEQAGKPGQEIITYAVTSIDGVEVSRQEVSRERIEPTAEIIAVGTFVEKPKPVITTETVTETESIPFTTEYRDNPNLSTGETKDIQEGRNGVRTITYGVTKENGVETKRDKVSEEVTTAPQPHIVERGTKVVTTETVTETEAIPFTTEYRDNPNLPTGETKDIQEGQNGVRTITYNVTKENGVETKREKISDEVTTAPQPHIVERGTKVVTTETVTETEAIPFTTEYRDNPNLPTGETKDIQEGQNGVRTITYNVTKENGVETKREKVSEEVTTAPQPHIVERGTKVVTTETVTETESIPFPTEYRDNPNLPTGETKDIQAGQNGVRTITYNVIKENGVETKREKISDEVTTAPQPHIVERGTKVAPKPVVTTEVVEEVIPFTTRRIEDSTLLKGTEVTDVEGQNGTIRKTYTVTTLDGKEIERVLTNTERTEPVEKVVRVGTANPKADLDWTAVDTLVGEADEVRLSVRYVYDNDTDKTNYDAEIERAKVAKSDYLSAEQSDLTQEQVNAMALAIENRKRQLDGQKTKPNLVITELLEDDLGRQATVKYQLADNDKAYQSAKAQLYDGDRLVKEAPIADISQPLALTDLDYFKPYTLKTVLTYDLGDGQVSETISDQRQIELEFKKIEFKDIDDVGLYRYADGRFVRQPALTGVPTDLNNYVVKINSDRHKEVILPVSSIVPTEVKGKQAYKVKVSFDELVQDTDTVYDQAYDKDYILTLDHLNTSAGVYTSFKDLVDAIKQNPSGEFRLGSDLSAAEVATQASDKAYIQVDFTGKLYGAYDGKAFAIHDLKQPLFLSLSNATVQQLDLKDVAINTSQAIVGALAKTATNTTISDVAVSGSITANREIGGLVATASQTTLTNVHFKGDLTATTSDSSGTAVGGVVASLDGNRAVLRQGTVDVNITVQGGSNNYKVGALAGKVQNGALVESSYAQGSVTGRKSGQIAGLIGSTWSNGRAQNLVSAVRVTNGNTIHGDSGYGGANIRDAFAVIDKATGTKDKWTTMISSTDAEQKLSGMNLTANLDDSGKTLVDNTYSVDYSKVVGAQAGREVAYANTEVLLPFYNKEYIVRMGNKIATTDKLYTTRLRDVVPMIDDKIVTDVAANKTAINRLMLHYTDDTVAYLDLAFKEDFRNNRVADYRITGTDLIYTPEEFLSTYDNVLAAVTPSLNSIALDSAAIRETLVLPTDDPAGKHLGYLYLSEAFDDVKSNLASQLRSLLSMDKAINTEGQVVEQDLIKKIKDNKAALLLGLSYLNRWYDIDFGNINTKQLSAFKLDFFGNSDKSVLDTIIALGNSGYDNLVAKNNDKAYDVSLAKAKGIDGLFTYLEKYRHLFLPNKTNNEWLKESSKAYIVENESLVDEVREKQKAAYGQKNNKYSIGVYDKITSDNWNWKNMLLPLLTMKDESVYVISNLATLSFGGYERYLYDKDSTDFITYMRNKVDQAAIWQRNHQDFWYKILSDKSKDKLFRTVLNYDGFNYRNDAKSATWRTLLDSDKSLQQFFGPVSKYYKANGSGAYADGSQTHFVVDRLLDQYGTSVYTHEMVHNSDGGIYFEGMGRREGQGAELFALGFLQNPNNLGMQTITINTMLTGEAEDEKRVHTANPIERFKNVDDLNQYIHGMYDMIYVLDYLEGQSLIKKDDAFKKEWLRRIENYYVTDKDGKQTHAGNQLVRLTDEEVAKLTNFEALIDGNVLTRRSYGDTNQFGRNGYYTISMFSPIFAALDNPNGAPGDIMFRRMAYELLAAKGYNDGFLPYVSNKFGDQALSEGSKTWSNWSGRYVGLVTDDIVFKNVFRTEYKSWADFKKAMYKERTDKLAQLKPITIKYKLGDANAQNLVTISSYEDLQRLMDEAMAYDANQLERSFNAQNSWVYKLKEKVYNAYIRQTDDFRQSIFN